MTWSYTQDAEAFFKQRRDYLVANESLNCLAWAAIKRSRNDNPDNVSHRFLTFSSVDAVIAHAIFQMRGQELILSPMSGPQAEHLADALAADGVQLKLVEGPSEAALRFARRWTERTTVVHELVMNQGLHELRSVEMPDLADGRLICATDEHRPVLLKFMYGFASCFSDQVMDLDKLDERTDRFLSMNRAFMWQDRCKTFVSMAVVVRESPHTASISWVFTPPQYRRRGHAAQVVATLSQAQLDAGKHACNLHTDLANPTSNGVYYRIGYRKISESVRLRLQLPQRTP